MARGSRAKRIDEMERLGRAEMLRRLSFINQALIRWAAVPVITVTEAEALVNIGNLASLLVDSENHLAEVARATNGMR